MAVAATIYSLYALYSTGEQAMLYGGIVTFAGWMLYGLVAGKLQVREAPEVEMLVDEDPAPSVGHRPRQTPGRR
jgi:putrescine:ornithine antiporter